MSHSIVLIFIFAITVIHTAQSECDTTMCTKLCQKSNLPTGTCNGNSCDCSYGKKCSLMTLSCKAACKRFNLDGSCLDDVCVCRIPIKMCFPLACTQQCLDDPRAKECSAAGGFVTPFACWMYGDDQICVCVCNLPAPVVNNQLNTNQNSSTELFRYTI